MSCVFYVCAIFTAFELAVLKLCASGSAPKSKMAAISTETNGGKFCFFFLHFHTDLKG